MKQNSYNMKSLYNTIQESLSELYHYTNGRNLVKILKYDIYKLSENDGYTKSYKYFMSTTRSKFSGIGYAQQLINRDVVRIVLDGDKLASKYKIIPIDVLKGKSWAIRANHVDPKAFDDNYNELMKQASVESEERLLSNNSEIRDFHKYIKYIYLDTNTINAKDADDIIRFADRLGVEVKIAENSKDFLYNI